MSAVDIAIIAENAVILAAVIIGGRLLKQGGGLQLKSAPLPKKAPQAPAEDGTVREIRGKAS